MEYYLKKYTIHFTEKINMSKITDQLTSKNLDHKLKIQSMQIKS
jgi:hypothetical protein